MGTAVTFHRNPGLLSQSSYWFSRASHVLVGMCVCMPYLVLVRTRLPYNILTRNMSLLSAHCIRSVYPALTVFFIINETAVIMWKIIVVCCHATGGRAKYRSRPLAGATININNTQRTFCESCVVKARNLCTCWQGCELAGVEGVSQEAICRVAKLANYPDVVHYSQASKVRQKKALRPPARACGAAGEPAAQTNLLKNTPVCVLTRFYHEQIVLPFLPRIAPRMLGQQPNPVRVQQRAER